AGETKNIIIATGSVPKSLPNLDIDGKQIITSDQVLELNTIPKSMIVLGAGAVGVEFASIYARFGSQVTVLELLPRALPIEDEDVSAEIVRAFKKRGITVHTETKVQKVDRKGGEIVVTATQ